MMDNITHYLIKPILIVQYVLSNSPVKRKNYCHTRNIAYSTGFKDLFIQYVVINADSAPRLKGLMKTNYSFLLDVYFYMYETAHQEAAGIYLYMFLVQYTEKTLWKKKTSNCLEVEKLCHKPFGKYTSVPIFEHQVNCICAILFVQLYITYFKFIFSFKNSFTMKTK